MTWKIRNAEFEPGNPFVHMHDPNVNLHMVNYLSNGTVETYIGNEDPSKARLFIRITDEGATVERAEAWTKKDLMIMDSVLKTLGASPQTRKRVLARFWQKFDQFQALRVVGDDPSV